MSEDLAVIPKAYFDIMSNEPETKWELAATSKEVVVKQSNLQTLEWFTFDEKTPVGGEILCYFNPSKSLPGFGPKYVISRPEIAIPIKEFYLKWAYLL